MALTLIEGCAARHERGTADVGVRDGDARHTLVSRAVSRAQVGDGDALKFLYARYADDIHGCVSEIVGEDAAAEEVTGHVFAELKRRIGGCEERDAFFAWALRLAREVAVDHVRRQRLVLLAGAKA